MGGNRTKALETPIFVTGGGGFLGLNLIKALLQNGHKVVQFSRNYYEELVSLGVHSIQGDLQDLDAVLKGMKGCKTVIHVAAKAGVWGSWESFHGPNVIGTQNVISACKALGINQLIYTSSPSVVFDGSDQENLDESSPYPEHWLANYPATKAMGEKLILAANSPELATVALRPHLIWGPGDRHLVPRVIAKQKSGRLKLVGDGSKLVDAVYIDNAVQAHLNALERLYPGSKIAGKSYFITNHEPQPMKDILNGILAAAKLPPVHKKVHPKLAYLIGFLMEKLWKTFHTKREPPITRFVAKQLSTAHWYNNQAATVELGYEPKVSMAKGFKRLETHFREQQNKDK